MKAISLDEMASVFSEMSNVETINRNEVVIHSGKHPIFGDVVLTQWGGDNFCTMVTR